MTLQPPFALFVLTKDTNVQWINDSLTRSRKGNFDFDWSFWVATHDYNDMPSLREDGGPPDGTKPPLPQDFDSSWAGKTFIDCGEWLQQIPSDAAVNRTHFAVLTEHSEGDDTFTACRIIQLDEPGKIDVEYFPQKVEEVGMQFVTNGGVKFDEKAQSYQMVCRVKQNPDRSYLRNP